MSPQPGVALPAAGKEVTDAMGKAVASHCAGVQLQPLERYAFYEEARTCYAVVQCLERRPYGNVRRGPMCHCVHAPAWTAPSPPWQVILQKGVVGPDGNDLKPEAEPAAKKMKK